MKERIILLIRAMNFTAAQFADEIGVQKSGISHIISGRNNPSLDFVQKILQRFPEVNMEWLIMGKGSMIKGEGFKSNEQEIQSSISAPGGNILAFDLFSEQISPPKEVKVPEKTAESIVEFRIPDDEKLDEELMQKGPATHLSAPEPTAEKKASTIQSIVEAPSKKLEKILFFYTDKTFTEYHPES